MGVTDEAMSSQRHFCSWVLLRPQSCFTYDKVPDYFFPQDFFLTTNLRRIIMKMKTQITAERAVFEFSLSLIYCVNFIIHMITFNPFKTLLRWKCYDLQLHRELFGKWIASWALHHKKDYVRQLLWDWEKVVHRTEAPIGCTPFS